MGDRFWHTSDVRQKLIDHCRRRQQIIEDTLATSENNLRSRFETEWKRSTAWRSAYREFEREKLNAGGTTAEEDVHDPFFETHDHIASDYGTKDWLKTDPSFPFYTSADRPADNKPESVDFSPDGYIVLLVTGFFALLGGLVVYLRPQGS